MAKGIHRYELIAVVQVVKTKPQALSLGSSMSYVDDFGLYHVVGKVVNVGSKYSTYTNTVVTFYDDDGRIITTGRDLTEPLNIPSGGQGNSR